MASASAPEQWSLTNTETIDSFESWRQNLLYHFSLDTNFSHMLKPGYKWEKSTKTKPYRGFKDDSDNVTTNKMTALEKSALLELMLGQIANYCPIIARNIIVQKSTSLDDVWHAIRKYFGFQKSGAHFLDYLDIKSKPDEKPEDLFQRMTAFIDDNLLSKEQHITHHGVNPSKDEEFTPTIENLVVLRWLYLLHPDLPSLVKQRYATSLRSKTLASLKLEISTSLDSLLRELRDPEGVNNANMPLQNRPAFNFNTHAPRKKSCPICKQALRRKYDHFLLKCPYLPDDDRSFLTAMTIPAVKEFEPTSKLVEDSTRSSGPNVEYANVQLSSTSQVVENLDEEADSQRTRKRHMENETDNRIESKLTRDADNNLGGCQESDSENEKSDSASSEQSEESEDDEPEDSKNDVTQLSESIFVYQNRKMSIHGNVFEGEVRSGVYGVRVCAIKIDRKSEQIAREARILSKINSHTHVISIIESGIYKNMFEERVYIALDKCHKHNLDQHIRHQNEAGVEFDLGKGLEYSKQIIAGVVYVHENLIIHKDLKLSNILLSQDKRTIKLADFGLSQEIKSTLSKVYSKHQFGTNGFRPIESFGNNWVSLKSDIFSLGVVLHFVLSNGKSPFGKENSLWTYNIQNEVMDLSQLLVSNTEMFQHLLQLMLSQERCRRPSIWQVADHPCWNGSEIECSFDYGFTEENDDTDVNIIAQENQDSSDSESEVESRRELLRALQKMGHDRPRVRKPSIIFFNRNSEHLQRFNPRDKTVTQMHEFNDKMKRNSFMRYHFRSVSVGDYVYVLMDDRSMYRLKYCDVTATWEQMADLIDDHGHRPPTVAASGSIILAGGSFRIFTRSVTKYDPLLNRWEKLKDKQLKTSDSTIVASQEFVYCLGGWIADIGPTERVERLNVASQSWDEIASMREARTGASAIESGGNLFVAGCWNREEHNSVEKYDFNVNQWTMMKPMKMKRSHLRCHLIDRNIYAVGPYIRGIEKYDVGKDEWEVIPFPGAETFNIYDSVSVMMKK